MFSRAPRTLINDGKFDLVIVTYLIFFTLTKTTDY